MNKTRAAIFFTKCLTRWSGCHGNWGAGTAARSGHRLGNGCRGTGWTLGDAAGDRQLIRALAPGAFVLVPS